MTARKTALASVAVVILVAAFGAFYTMAMFTVR